jgi:hypothetical protein
MKRVLVLALVVTALQFASAAPSTLSLAGSWRFRLDRADTGLQEKWFERTLPQKVKLPGSLPAQGIGDEVKLDTHWTGDIVDKSWFTAPEYAPYRQPDNLKVPFWLQPTKYYAGVAWYQRTFKLPADWQGKRVVLTLERPHWETRVWVDGKALGSNNSLSTPHEYDLGTALAPGKHQLTIRVNNGLVVDVGVNSHCISDHTQGNWNGIVGDISLRATAPVWVKDLQVYPDLTTKSVRVKGQLGNATARAGKGQIGLSVGLKFTPKQERELLGRFGPQTNIPVAWEAQGGSFEATLPVSIVKDPQAWDEFNPEVYCLTAELSTNTLGTPVGPTDSATVPFGLREISTQGSQLLLNGHKAFIRGTLECCIFPLTGHPPTDVESWRRIISIAKAHGLNLLRFHSYCPPEAAFTAADEMGMYFQIETCWANQSTTLGDGKPVDQWVYDETDRILKTYGNHPSFLLMPYGNEPGGKNTKAYLAKWVAHYKALDSRRLWTSGSGWPQIPENQFHITPDPRIQAWGQGLKSRINAKPPETVTDYRDYIAKRNVPVISHEIGQWCVYPNFEEMSAYKGYLKPRNFEIFRDTLRARGLGEQAHDFLLASGKLQTLCYKEDIESALRTPGMGGFELLDLHDFPGQGTALVGVLDPFWRDKGYVTADEYRRFCNPTVPLARLSKRVFTTEEKLAVTMEVAHFGPAPLVGAVTSWRLVADNGKVMAVGKLDPRNIPLGNGTELGRFELTLTDLPAPAHYKLVVALSAMNAIAPYLRLAGEKAPSGPDVIENDWDIWVYLPKVATRPAPGITIVRALDDQTVSALTNGGKALLLIPPTQVKGDARGQVALGFSSIFWNTAWTKGQPPHTLGILCDPKQPALEEFPTDFHSNWQWWYLISRAEAMILNDLPTELRPTVQVIDDWVTNRKLGLLFEAKVGLGKLMVCSIDLEEDVESNPVACQLRRSLLDYMTSPKFKPAVALTPEQIRGLMTAPQK